MVELPLDHLPPLTSEDEAASKARWAETTFKSVSGEWWQYLAKKVCHFSPVKMKGKGAHGFANPIGSEGLPGFKASGL